MKTASEYRAMAEECFGWAREAHRDEVRESYMQLAQVWLNAASLVDGAPPTRIAPPEMTAVDDIDNSGVTYTRVIGLI